MAKNKATLFTSRRFFPYFLTQFFGAFNDNIFKNVLLLLVAFTSASALPISNNLFINLAAGLFILPFFLFSATAGVIADKYEKSALIRKIKLAEIIIMGAAAIAFLTDSYTLLLLLLFLMGTQSAFFGPVKYALLPQQLRPTELVTGNALVETGTFLAILLGTIAAGIITASDYAREIIAIAVLLCAIIGYVASRAIPYAPASAPNLAFRWQPILHTKQTLTIAHSDRVILLSLLAISWFWFLGATYLTQFPSFSQHHLHGNEHVVSFLLTLFSVGIAAGSLLCSQLSKQRIEIGLVPIGSLGMSLFGYLMTQAIPDSLPHFETLAAFISYQPLWAFSAYLLLIGVSGGLFIVPLYALVQQRAKATQRAQVIAALNIYNALFMVGSAVLGILCLSLFTLSIVQLFILVAVLNLLVTIYIFFQVPIFVVRFLAWVLVHTMYRLRCKNFHHFPQEGGALVICNHVSFLDGILLSAASPRMMRFVMEEDYANHPLVRRFLKRAGVIPIAAGRRETIRQAFDLIEQALKDGDLVCIFPEGRLTKDGEMHEFQRGVEMIIKRTPAPIVPLALKGMWGSYFSRYKGRACQGLPQRFRAQIEIEAGEPVLAQDTDCKQLFDIVAKLRGDWR